MEADFALQMSNPGFDRTLTDAWTLAHRRERTGVVVAPGTHLNRRHDLQSIQKQSPLLLDQLLPHSVWPAEDMLLAITLISTLTSAGQHARGAEGGDQVTSPTYHTEVGTTSKGHSLNHPPRGHLALISHDDGNQWQKTRHLRQQPRTWCYITTSSDHYNLE